MTSLNVICGLPPIKNPSYDQWRIQKILVGGDLKPKPQNFGCLHQNWDWFFGRNRKFKRFFRPNSGGLQKKKKRSSPKLRLIFRPDSLRLGRWGGDASRNGAELFKIRADFSAKIVTFRLVGGMHPPIPPLKSATGYDYGLCHIKMALHSGCVHVQVQLLDRRASNRKVADFRFDSQTGNSLLCPWEKQRVFPISDWGKAIYLLRWPSLTKNLQTEPKSMLCVGVVLLVYPSQQSGPAVPYAWTIKFILVLQQQQFVLVLLMFNLCPLSYRCCLMI